MEKIPLKAANVIDNFVQAVLELNQVMDLSEEQQKMVCIVLNTYSIGPSTDQ